MRLLHLINSFIRAFIVGVTSLGNLNAPATIKPKRSKHNPHLTSAATRRKTTGNISPLLEEEQPE